MSIESALLKRIVEGALMAAGKPLSVKQLIALFTPPENGELDLDPEEEVPTKEEILATLEDIQGDCDGRGFELKEVGSGWRFQVIEETANWVSRLWEEKPQRYTRALLETLVLIAYRQPITRGDIESIRGVAVSSNIIKTLTEREWVKVVGHRDVPGRPALYATTREFLDYFNLKSLDELPSLKDIKDLDKLGDQLDLGDPVQNLEAEAESAELSDTAEVESEEPDENLRVSSEESEDNVESNISPLFPNHTQQSAEEKIDQSDEEVGEMDGGNDTESEPHY